MKISKKLFALFGLFFILHVNGIWAMQLSSQTSPVSSQDSSLSSSCEQEVQNEVQQVTNEKVEACISIGDKTSLAQPEVDDEVQVFPTKDKRDEFGNDLNAVKIAAKELTNSAAFTITALCERLEKIASANKLVKQWIEKKRLHKSKLINQKF